MRTCPFCRSTDAYSVQMMQCGNCGTTDEDIYRFKLTTRKGLKKYVRRYYKLRSTWNRKRNKHGRIGVARNVKGVVYDKHGRPRPNRLHRNNARALRGGRAALRSHPGSARQRGVQSVG